MVSDERLKMKVILKDHCIAIYVHAIVYQH